MAAALSLLILTTILLTLGCVNSEVSSWFTSGNHHQHNANDIKNTTTEKSLHEILNVTKGEMKTRDVGPPPAVPPPPPPPVPSPPFPGFGGYFPGAGAGAGLNLGFDAGIGGGLVAGILPYFPIVEKVIVIIGGGILILIFLALLHASLLKGGFLSNFGHSFSKAFAGDVDFDLGPFHASKSAAGAVAFDQNAGLTNRVMNGVNTRW